jgi:hypothetical protein
VSCVVIRDFSLVHISSLLRGFRVWHWSGIHFPLGSLFPAQDFFYRAEFRFVCHSYFGFWSSTPVFRFGRRISALLCGLHFTGPCLSLFPHRLISHLASCSSSLRKVRSFQLFHSADWIFFAAGLARSGLCLVR